MKTVDEILKEKAAIVSEIEQLEKQLLYPNSQEKSIKTSIKNLRKKLEFVRMIEMYLRSNPTEEYLQKEKHRLSNRIEAIRHGEPPYPKNEGSIPFLEKSCRRLQQNHGRFGHIE